MDEDERVAGAGFATFEVTRGDGRAERWHNRLGFDVGPGGAALDVGGLVGAPVRLPAERPDARRYLHGVVTELERQRRRNTIHPVPKPAPAKPKGRAARPDPSRLAPCPLCNGEVPRCPLCQGDGWVTAREAEAWRQGHE